MTVADLYRNLDRTISRLRPDPLRDLHMIDYAHLTGGVLYHGSLSDLDGTPRATWTYEDAGELVTRDRPLDQETFERLWHGCAASVFQQAIAVDMARPVDPTAFHIVSLVFTQNGAFGRCASLIAAGEIDAEFVAWLQLLNRPDTPAVQPGS
jgi:hypothetical protein